MADEVRRAHATVCAFPVNGTRRWFLLEHPEATTADYIEINGRRHVELYQLLFEHGIDTILAPMYEPVMQQRGEDYQQNFVAKGLATLATHPTFTRFYDEQQVRVRFYGNYRRIFPGTVCAPLPDFDRVMQQTQTHGQCRLFYGVSTRGAVEEVLELVCQTYAAQEPFPNRRH